MLDFDLGNPDHVRDPYPVLRALREQDPVHRSAHLDGWVLTRHADVNRAIRAPELSVDTIRPFVRAKAPHDPDVARLARLAPLWAIFNDPPDHTRLRAALNHSFTIRQVEALRGFVADVSNTLLGYIVDRGECEFVRDFAFPLPALVIARLLGVPDCDVHRFKRWSDDLGEFITTSINPDRYARERRDGGDGGLLRRSRRDAARRSS